MATGGRTNTTRIAATHQRERVAAWPRVSATVRPDGRGSITVNGTERPCAAESVDELRTAMTDARGRIDAGPTFVLPTWQAWLVVPEVVEFWQGSPDRAHVRLVYRRDAAGWTHGLVWP